MKNCPYCGTTLNANAVQCHICGFIFYQYQQPQQAYQQSQQAYQQPQQAYQQSQQAYQQPQQAYQQSQQAYQQPQQTYQPSQQAYYPSQQAYAYQQAQQSAYQQRSAQANAAQQPGYQQYYAQQYQNAQNMPQQYGSLQNGEINADGTAQQTSAKAFGKTQIAIIFTVVMFVVLAILALMDNAGMISSGGGGLFGQSQASVESEYISFARQIVSEALVAPSTVKWGKGEILDKDDYGRVLVYIEYDAQNAHGAFLRCRHLVLIKKYLPETNQFQINRTFGVAEYDGSMNLDTQIEVMKSLNNWGEPFEE